MLSLKNSNRLTLVQREELDSTPLGCSHMALGKWFCPYGPHLPWLKNMFTKNDVLWSQEDIWNKYLS